VTPAAGYSGTPLAKKLGIKEGFRVHARNEPEGYRKLLAPLPAGVTFASRAVAKCDLVHWFETDRAKLARGLPRLMDLIRPDKALWISWPKKSSGVPTTITEDVIREVALPLGLVDVKVCAVDETWSGLKLVIRREMR